MHTSGCASSATAAGTCTHGSSATRRSSPRGMAVELTLDAAHSAVYHVLGAPGIASFTAACLTADRAIDLGRLERLVAKDGEPRQRLLFEVAAELYGREQGGLAERAARRAGRRRPRSRALRNGRAQGPPKHKLGMARRSLDTRLRTRVAARVPAIGLRPRLWRSAAEAPRSACCASHGRGVSMPTTYLKSTGIPLLCARAALAQDDRHADPAEQT
jgi:hypothetical protein